MMNLLPRGFYLDDIFDDMNKEMVKPANHMKCDVSETEKEYTVEMDIPGYKKHEIKIECNDGLLTITAEKKEEKKEENKGEEKDKKKYIRRERFYGKISRGFSFPDMDENKIKAKFEDGTLLLTIPKKENVDNKKLITID